MITNDDIVCLEESVSRMNECKNDIDKYVDEDLYFHVKIAEITKNSLVIQLYYIISNVLREIIKKLTETVGFSNGLKYHQLIIDALKIRDEYKVKEVMREHVQQAIISFSSL